MFPLLAEIVQAVPANIEFEIVYVDDGSDDNTLAELKTALKDPANNLVIVRHQSSCGQSTALHSGVRQARGRFIVTMDADGQNDPADIPALLAKADLQNSEHFCIAGNRKTRRDTWSKRIQSRIANNIRQSLLGDNTPDTGCGLKMFPRETFLLLPYFDHMHRFLPALIRRLDGNIVVVDVNHRERTVGQSKYTLFSRLWVGIVDLLGVMWLKRRTRVPVILSSDD